MMFLNQFKRSTIENHSTNNQPLQLLNYAFIQSLVDKHCRYSVLFIIRNFKVYIKLAELGHIFRTDQYKSTDIILVPKYPVLIITKNDQITLFMHNISQNISTMILSKFQDVTFNEYYYLKHLISLEVCEYDKKMDLQNYMLTINYHGELNDINLTQMELNRYFVFTINQKKIQRLFMSTKQYLSTQKYYTNLVISHKEFRDLMCK